MISVAVVGPAPLFRSGIRVGLRGAGFAAEEVADLISWARLGGDRAAVVSVNGDHQLEEVTRARAVNPELVVVVVAEGGGQPRVADALRAGATSCLSGAAAFDDLVDALRLALRGRTVMATQQARDLAAAVPATPQPLPVSEREAGWIRTLAGGATVTKLARDCGYSEREMYRLLSDTYARMGVHTRTEALLLAAGWGLLN